MKVAYLLGSLNRGGTETLILDTFKNAKINNLNAIGVYRKSGVYEKEFIESGVAQYKLNVGKNIISYIISLRKLLIDNNIDVAHAQQPIDALYAFIACFGSGIKIILSFHGYDFTINKFGKLILNFIIKKTDCNIYVSDNQRNYYQSKYKLVPNNQKLVYNGISFNKFVDSNNDIKLNSDKNIHNELNLSTDTLFIGSIGNFNEVRDQLTICRFLNLLKQENVNFHFIFVGKKIESLKYLYDECLDFCEHNNLENKVSFLGSRNDVPAILKELDAFIYSTNHDTFGIAVVEAMYAKIPVFVNDWGVMNEITENGKYATVYKTKDEIDLYHKFMNFIHNKTEFINMSDKANVFVENKFSIENHIDYLKEVYGNLIKH